MISLNLRVLIAASAILSSFFGLAGITLDLGLVAKHDLAVGRQLLARGRVARDELALDAGLDARSVPQDRDGGRRALRLRGERADAPG